MFYHVGMDDREAGAYWEENAETWSILSAQGYNVYRDYINTPATLAMLPDLTGLRGLDLGCGDGAVTALLAQRSQSIVGVDLSPTFLRHARNAAPSAEFVQATAQNLPFPSATFDFAVASMSLMDMPQPQLALRETARVLKPAGFLQFSVMHPCFTTPVRHKVRDQHGRVYAMAVGGYFDRTETIEEWIFNAAPPEARAGLRKFRLPVFRWTVADWLNMVADAGLRIERAEEPCATPEIAEKEPKVADSRLVPYFLHLLCRKGERY